ncbi:hypothetical protein F5J12DRAFT_894095 [Pisolithus orientalis]|uniref:uncharacterized protein n=1 Tax=Pisolithus orientalis TaxID=936130 RepID=UPI00222559FD|nr:uncharacterized protein F5J12DRAFT_894095 [Pisolithus orientalis]KAI6002353.1 hypothetical protein F5J12DRAFT_894095 [Pisolithus orientalis]
MSANHAPQLSQLVHMPTLDPMEAERASLREQLAAASAGLVAEARCVPDDWEDMWEEKMTQLRCWEEKMAVLMPLVKQGKALRVSVWVDAEDAPALMEANDLYEKWSVEEAEECVRARQDVQMEEAMVEVGHEAHTCTTKAPKASPSKWAHGDDIMEVVKGKTHRKGKAPVHGRFDGKTAMDILQALRMVRAKAVAAHVANLHLQVHIKQLLEALAKLGVE